MSGLTGMYAVGCTLLVEERRPVARMAGMLKRPPWMCMRVLPRRLRACRECSAGANLLLFLVPRADINGLWLRVCLPHSAVHNVVAVAACIFITR